MDGDGDVDVVSASPIDDKVAWYENVNGSGTAWTTRTISLAADGAGVVVAEDVDGDGDTDVVSGSLFNGTVAWHEANALVENLLVYRDANGNGIFDPGVDVLVATVPTLALTNGIQTVTFADGDPNAQVALGPRRTYFVVTELTATASAQVPNQFQVTHLGTGPSASAAEDRTYDIRLRLACPTDVASSNLGPITPVDLIGFTVE